MGLRDIESTLPPGFRFYPSDEELVCYYLQKKVANEISPGTLVEVDLHAREPWELPEVAKLSADEWYFFSFRDRKYATGSRTNRATKSGYWKATGKDRMIHDPATRAIIGMRKTLVFYRGRAPNGQKTGWVMHEFRLETPHSQPKEDWVLCRVFHKRKGEAEAEQVNSSSGPSSPTLVSSSPHAQDQSVAEQLYNHQVISSSSVVLPMDSKHENNNNNSSNQLLNLAMLQYNFLEFPQEIGCATMMELASRSGDESGVLYDAGFEDHGMHLDHEMAMANFGGLRWHGGKDGLFF